MIEGLKESASRQGGSRNVEPTQPAPTQLDDYKIVREIGRGGMGVVYEAVHESLARRVAVKVLTSRLTGDASNLSRFEREAQAAARLRHPNIVPVFGVGHADGIHYYVMEYIEGRSVREFLNPCCGRPSISDSGNPTRRSAILRLGRKARCEFMRRAAICAQPRCFAPRHQTRQPVARRKVRGLDHRLRTGQADSTAIDDANRRPAWYSAVHGTRIV